jgi:hypothetical protein
LYGPLYSLLAREIPEQFELIVRTVGLSVSNNRILPAALRENEEYQHRLFDIIAGDAMGGGRNRGLPYTWLISHLADARNQVSPRTFLRALRFAAHNPPAPLDTAIVHLGIHQGVREASTNRIDDLKEDYPWVPLALDSLRGLVVPCLPEDMLTQWRKSGDLIARMRSEVPKGKHPAWLADANDSKRPPYSSLLSAMASIGVFENRLSTGKVDVPDIFRLKAGIKRKGGVTPQQRRRAPASSSIP